MPNEKEGQLGRRAMAVGVGAMLLSSTLIAGCATPAPADNVSTGKGPLSLEKADMPYNKPAPFTAIHFWTSMLELIDESFTTSITHERVEKALGREFARFSSPRKEVGFLKRSESWYFDVLFSARDGYFATGGLAHDGVFSGGSLMLKLAVERLEIAGWSRHQISPHDIDSIGYVRDGKFLSIQFDKSRVSGFAISLASVAP